MTERQLAAMKRLDKSGCEYLSPDLAKQLVKKGLVELTGRKYQRMEWQRPVRGATLWEVRKV